MVGVQMGDEHPVQLIERDVLLQGGKGIWPAVEEQVPTFRFQQVC
jgi:hypothetical protein